MKLPPPLLADRTPIVLSMERLRSVPPPARSAAWEAVDDAAPVVVWLVLCACVLVLVAVVLLAGAAALGGWP